jgi:hypothetical protein
MVRTLALVNRFIMTLYFAARVLRSATNHRPMHVAGTNTLCDSVYPRKRIVASSHQYTPNGGGAYDLPSLPKGKEWKGT